MKKILDVFLAELIVCVSSINYSTAAEVLIDSESRLGGLLSLQPQSILQQRVQTKDKLLSIKYTGNLQIVNLLNE